MIDHAEREQNIVGMMHTVMMQTEDLAQVEKFASLISPGHFYTKAAKTGFEHIKRFVDARQPFDAFNLRDAVSQDAAGGSDCGAIIMDACQRNAASYVSLKTNVEIQKKHSMKVEAVNYLNNLHGELIDSDDVLKTAGQAASFFEGLAGNLSGQFKQSKHITEVAGEYIAQLEYDMSNPDEAGGLPTGFVGLDSILGMRKILPGTLMVIGARPGMGKTGLMTYMMVEQANARKDKAFIGYSLEMPRVSLYERIVKDQTGYSYEETLNGDDTVFAMVTQLTANMRDTQLYMNDSANMTIEDIEADARNVAKERDVAGIYVDYLTIMQMPKKDRHDLSVGEITRRLKKLSIELNCSVVLLAQLNRSIDEQGRRDKRPIAKDLRDSGSIEQDADYILFPYRDIVYNEQSVAQEYSELILRKNRHGRVGTAYARFVNGRFMDCDQEQGEIKCRAAENEKSQAYSKPEKGLI